VKNFLAITLLSLGTPMLLMGDEMRRTQRGNNNAYCQDNELSWLDWSLLTRHADVHRFVKRVIEFRLSLASTEVEAGVTLAEVLRRSRVEWHGVRLGSPDWSDDSYTVAFTIERLRDGQDVHAILNAYWEPLTFELPPAGAGRTWRRIVDTSRPSPQDACVPAEAPAVQGHSYLAAPRSVVVLVTAPATT
jgi:glycogen operon protein